MSNILYYPNAGRMPALDALPASLHSSIAQLSTLPCIQGVVTGVDPYHNKMVFLVAFADGQQAEFTQTLNCFKGFHPARIDFNRREHFLQLSFSETFIA